MKTETHADPGLEKFERFKREGVMSALHLIDAAKLELSTIPSRNLRIALGCRDGGDNHLRSVFSTKDDPDRATHLRSIFAEEASPCHLRSLFAGDSGPAEPAHLRSVFLH